MELLKTRYDTYTVTDNFCGYNNAVFATNNKIEDIIGYGFVVKELIDKNINVIGILNKLESKGKINKLKSAEKYTDKLFKTIDEFKDWAGGLAW